MKVFVADGTGCSVVFIDYDHRIVPNIVLHFKTCYLVTYGPENNHEIRTNNKTFTMSITMSITTTPRTLRRFSSRLDLRRSDGHLAEHQPRRGSGTGETTKDGTCHDQASRRQGRKDLTPVAPGVQVTCRA